jgi:hypothetical protein
VKSGTTITFTQMLDEVGRIEIPIIQRDYAQGRDSATEIRLQFLASIFDTLSIHTQEHRKPLDLDFIYGSVDGDSGGKFWPLDGQQRLTTLFLLHWYLACQDGESEQFQRLVLIEGKSRFTYETRRSSYEFFTALASHVVDLDGLPKPDRLANALSSSIRDRTWFFLSWGLDPTIQSALSMLDAIDAQFRGHQGLFARILNIERPYITFQFLNLEEFGLSDELYIKMNARGKPLTAFENFKARFEQYVDGVCRNDTKEFHGRTVSLGEYLARKIDTDWSDFFWQWCGADTSRFDEQFVQFFRSMISVLLPIGRARGEKDKLSSMLETIRKGGFTPSFYQYAKLGCLDRTLVINLIDFMDTVCTQEKPFRAFLEDSSFYDERAVFGFALERLETRGASPKGLTYQRAMMFFAWCLYLIKYKDNVESASLFDWLRVIHNLSENTRVERPTEFTDALFSIMDLSDHGDAIIAYLAELDEDKQISFFYAPQVREERIKAQLIQCSPEWRKALIRAEVHGYFKGQIEFLLDFSGVLGHFMEAGSCDWGEEEDHVFLGRFTDYLQRAEAVFDSSGLKHFSDSRFERALLSKGDYLLPGRSNYSFLDNEDRDTSWKRLLRGAERANDPNRTTEKRTLLGGLLASLELNDIERSLAKIIDAAEPTNDWRWPFISHFQLIDYCAKRYIRRVSDDHIYLMKRIQMNGAHLEMWSYFLYWEHLHDSMDLYPFQKAEPVEGFSYSDEPSVRLEGMYCDDTAVRLNVTYRHGEYVLTLDQPSLMDKLEDSGKFQRNAAGYAEARIPRADFPEDFPVLLKCLGHVATNSRTK